MTHRQNRWMTFLKQIRHKNRSVFLTWLLSYISVLLIPILISGIIYGATLHVVKTEINRANESILLQMEQAIDSQLKGMESLGFEVGLNKRISAFITADTHLSDGDHYEIYQIANDLRVYEIANEFIEKIYIYYKNSDTVVTRNERLHGKSLYEILRFEKNQSFEEFSGYFDQRYIRGYSPVYVNDGQEWKPSVMYAQSVELTSRGQPGAILLFMINHNKLLAQASVPEGGSIMILGEDNRMIASTVEQEYIPSVRYEEMPDESGQIEGSASGIPTVTSYITSPITGWKYVMILPAEVYHQKMNVVKQLTFASILLCLIVGGIVTYFFLKRNYTPIHTLIQSLSFKAGVRFNKGSNEFSFLETALNNTFHEREELHHKLNQHDNTLRSHFLQRLLKGQLDSSIPLHESFSAHDVRFGSPNFSVLLLRIEHFGKFDQEADGRVRSSRLLHFLIANVVEEVARKSVQAYTVDLDNDLLACIINHKFEDLIEHRTALQRIAEETKTFILHHAHVNLTIAVSTPQEGEYGISQAFQESLEAMEYSIVIGSGGVIHYEDLRTMDGIGAAQGYFYPLKAEQQLITLIREGSTGKAEAFLEELIHKNLNAEPFSFHNAKCLMFDIMATLLKSINEIRKVHNPELLDGARAIERLIQCQTVGEMREQLYELLRQLCNYVNDNREHNSNPLIDNIMKYVSEQYQNENLNISMIGEILAMTPSYVSKLFREHTGQSLLDYINKTRLTQAKLLLSGQKHTVSEVAVMVGYTDVNTFHRIFKKFEGVTPGRYREIQ